MTSVNVFEEKHGFTWKNAITYPFNSFLMFLFLPLFAYNLWMSICLCKSEN